MMGTHSPWGANDSDNDDEVCFTFLVWKKRKHFNRALNATHARSLQDYAAGSKKKGKRKGGLR